MLSRLFELAASSLDADERSRIEALQAELAATRSPENLRLVENLQAEAHLVGDEEFGNAEALVAFLRACGSSHAPPSDAAACYDRSCKAHLLKGLRIPLDRLPPGLLRYTISRHLASALIGRVLGVSARADFDDDLYAEDLLGELVAAWDPGAWDPVLLDGLFLGRDASVFATFEHSAGPSRTNARALSEALALPFWGMPRTTDELLIELSYPTGGVTETRFATVADAGLMHLFRPAHDLEPSPSDPLTWHGWTQPIGTHPPQPELVHANAPISILDHPPRFVGRVPL
jgi:hypothetical protein